MLKNAFINRWSKKTRNIGLSLLLIVAQLTPFFMSQPVRADGNGSPDQCLDTAVNVVGSVIGTASLVTYDVGSGYVVDGVCIKSGEKMFNGNQHSAVLGNGTYETDCYTVSGVGTQQVTVTKIGSGPNCQDISHIDVVKSPVAGSITIKKNAIPDSSQSFNFSTTGLSTDASGFSLIDDSTSGLPEKVFGGLSAGIYVISEDTVAGWDFDEVTCSQGSGVQKDDSEVTITLSAGENVVCTFTNRMATPPVDFCDPAQKPGGMSIYEWLTSQNEVPECVKYAVTNVCGEFGVNLTLNDTPYSYGFSYSENVESWNYNTDASSVTFPEDYNGGSVDIYYWGVGPEKDYFTALGLPWYNVSSEKVTVDTDCEPNEPELHVRKRVINDDSGQKYATDFNLYVNGELLTNPVAGGGELADNSVTYMYDNAEVGVLYEVTEDSTSSYAASDVVCVDTANNNTPVVHPVTLSYDQKVSCVITNNDIPGGNVTLNKNVINDNGGTKTASDFPLYLIKIGTLQPISVQSGVEIFLSAGAYVMYEDNNYPQQYYSEGWDGDCKPFLLGTGLLVVKDGNNYECTVTNNDKPGKIVVHKEVINNNGGKKKAKDFRFKIDRNGQWQNFSHSGTNYVLVDAGWHSVYEDEDHAYRADYEGCKHIYVKNGETKHCYITNDDKAPEVKVMKTTDPYWSEQSFDFVMKNNGQYYDSFSLNTYPYDQTPGSYDTGHDFKAGWVYVHEKEVEGWDNIWIKCFKKSKHGLEYVGHPFKAEVGKDYICKVSNKQRGNVVVTKFYDNNQNGLWDEDEEVLPDWTITLEDDDECEIEVGEDVVNALLSYDERKVDCDQDSVSMSQLTDENGQASFTNLKSGKYVVGEELKEGWVQSGIYCDYGREEQSELSFNQHIVNDEAQENDGNLYLIPGGTVYCYIGNYNPQIELTVEPICRDNFPYLRWNAKVTNLVSAPTQFTLKWYTVSGNSASDPAGELVHTQVVPVSDTDFDGTDTYSSETLWPGADTVTPDWPGWKMVNNLWVEDPSDFGGNLQPSVLVGLTVNPTDDAVAAYPSGDGQCNPSNPAVLGASTTSGVKLASTGQVTLYANLLATLLLIGSVAGLYAVSQKETR